MSRNDPIGRNKMNTTTMQDDGNETAHLPSAPDNANGILVDASTETRLGSSIGYAPLPGEGDWKTANQQAIRAMDEAKRRAHR